jgi:methionyl-tRNA formyltransferase
MRTLFIGSRPLALRACLASPHAELTGIVGVDLAEVPDLPRDVERVTLSADSGRVQALGMLRSTDFDLLVSAGCPWRLPIDELPAGRTYINCHPSALPLGRGRHPVTEALLAEHRTAGVSVHHMDPGIDTGPVIAARTFPVTDDIDAAILYGLIFELEAEVLGLALERLAAGGAAARGVKQTGPTTTYSRPARRPTFDPAATPVHFMIDNARAWMLHGGIEIAAGGRTFVTTRAAAITSPFVVERLGGAPIGAVCLEVPGALIIRARDGFLRLLDFTEL